MNKTPTPPEFEIPNPQVQSLASQFADAAVFLYNHLRQLNCVPSVLLEGAFAIELYLKSLSSKTIAHPLEECPGGFQLTASPTKRVHPLLDLFDAIDEPIRDELQQAYAAAPVIRGVSLLRDELGRYNRLFEDTRYSFERRDGGGNSITDLIHLLQFFRKQVDGMPRQYRHSR